MKRLLYHPAKLFLRLANKCWERRLRRELGSFGVHASWSAQDMQAYLYNVHGVTVRAPKLVRLADNFVWWTLRRRV